MEYSMSQSQIKDNYYARIKFKIRNSKFKVHKSKIAIQKSKLKIVKSYKF